MPPILKAKKPVNPQKPDQIKIEEKLPCEVWKIRFKTMEQSRDQYRNYSLKMVQANTALEKRLQDIEKDLSDALFYIHVQDQAKIEETDRLRSNLQNVTNQKCRELAEIEAQYMAKCVDYQGVNRLNRLSRFELSKRPKSRSIRQSRSFDGQDCTSEGVIPLKEHVEMIHKMCEQFEVEKAEMEKKFQVLLSEVGSRTQFKNELRAEDTHLSDLGTKVDAMQQEHLSCNKDNTLGVGQKFSGKKREDLQALQPEDSKKKQAADIFGDKYNLQETMITLLQHNEQQLEHVNHMLEMKNEELNRVKALLNDMIDNKSCVDEFFVNVLNDIHKLQRPVRRRCRSLSQPRRRKSSRSASKKRKVTRGKNTEDENSNKKLSEDFSLKWDPKIGLNWKTVSFEDKQNIVLKFADKLKNATSKKEERCTKPTLQHLSK